MDELKRLILSLKYKRIIKGYSMRSLLLIIAGSFLLTIGFVYVSFDSFMPFVFFIVLSAACTILGIGLKLKAMDMDIELEASDIKRINTQPRIHPPAAGSIVRSHFYCPSCGKPILPIWRLWNVCGYCGKRLKKSD